MLLYDLRREKEKKPKKNAHIIHIGRQVVGLVYVCCGTGMNQHRWFEMGEIGRACLRELGRGLTYFLLRTGYLAFNFWQFFALLELYIDGTASIVGKSSHDQYKLLVSQKYSMVVKHCQSCLSRYLSQSGGGDFRNKTPHDSVKHAQSEITIYLTDLLHEAWYRFAFQIVDLLTDPVDLW